MDMADKTEVIQYTIGMSNGFFIRQGETVLAVDGGGELNADAYLEVCAKNGIDPKKIKLIILTHGHVDHFVNLGVVKELTGAPLLCHKKAEKDVREGLEPRVSGRNKIGKIVLEIQAKMGNPISFIPKVEPDILIEGEYDLKPWGVDGRLIETPGHSADSISVVLETGDVLVGDLIAAPPEGPVTLAFLSDIAGDPDCNKILYESVGKVLAGARCIYSGHGGPYTPEEVYEAWERDKAEFAEA